MSAFPSVHLHTRSPEGLAGAGAHQIANAFRRFRNDFRSAKYLVGTKGIKGTISGSLAMDEHHMPI